MLNPNFPVVTFAVWAEKPNAAISSQLSDKAAEMAAEGKTDNLPEYDFLTPEMDVRRNWLDISAANEWIASVQGCGGPLESITIES